jgi:hypothetical protein
MSAFGQIADMPLEPLAARPQDAIGPQIASNAAIYLASFSFARTSSMLKVAAFCRGGKSLNVARNSPT